MSFLIKMIAQTRIKAKDALDDVDKIKKNKTLVQKPIAKEFEKNSIQNMSSQPSSFQKRRPVPNVLFVVLILTNIALPFQSPLFFFTGVCTQKIVYTTFTYLVFIFILLAISKYFASLGQMFMLYFMLDTITVSYIVCIIGFMGLCTCLEPLNLLYARIVQVLIPIVFFTVAGSYRVIIKNANFSKCQNIIFKTVIFIDGLGCFMIGFYVMYFEFRLSKGMSPQTDLRFKDFNLLFVFGGLALYKQFCNLHNRFDRTDRLIYDYKLIDQVQTDEVTNTKQN